MKTNLRIGLIGAGRIGQIHAQNLAFRIPGVELVAIADVDKKAAEACAARCHVDKVFDDARPVINDRSIDAVVICSATPCHADQIIAAAEAGKQIFCEKPLDLSLDKIDRTLDAVARAGVKLQVGFNRRYDPGFRRARDLISAGKIGKPHIVRITSRDPSPPPPSYIKASGGMFVDMTIHDFDMARWIVTDEISSMCVAAAVLVDPQIGALGDVDTAIISFRYRQGGIGSIDNSRRAVYGYDQRIEVFGSEGVVVVGNVAPTTAVLSDRSGVHGDLPLHFFLERYEQAYVDEMRDFIDCLKCDRAPAVTGIDGRIPVVLAASAKQALEANRWVDLSY